MWIRRSFFYLAHYVMCPGGEVRTGPLYSDGPEAVPADSDPPLLGHLCWRANSFRGWRLQGPEHQLWSPVATRSGNTGYDGIFYFHEGSATVGGNAGNKDIWSVTIIASAVAPNTSCPTVYGGDINIKGNPRMQPHPDAQSFLMVAGRDIEIPGNSHTAFTYAGIIMAYEQVQITGNPTISGVILVSDVCNTPGSLLDGGERGTGINGNPTINYDGSLAFSLGTQLSIDRWNELR